MKEEKLKQADLEYTTVVINLEKPLDFIMVNVDLIKDHHVNPVLNSIQVYIFFLMV